MKIISVSELVKNVAKKWKSVYFFNGRWNHETPSCPKEGVYKKLSKLGKNRTKENVDGIIGNSSWTTIQCHECGSDVDCLVQLGEMPDYESATANICCDCLKKAIKMIEVNKTLGPL